MKKSQKKLRNQLRKLSNLLKKLNNQLSALSDRFLPRIVESQKQSDPRDRKE